MARTSLAEHFAVNAVGLGTHRLRAVEGATVVVKKRSDDSLVTIWDAYTGGAPISPALTDAAGLPPGYVDRPGEYKAEISKPGEIDDLVYNFDVEYSTDDVQLRAEKGAASGYASLDGTGKVPSGQLPSLPPLPSVMEYKGLWNPNTNTPALANGSGDTGDVYRASVNGAHDFGAGIQDIQAGDQVIYDGAAWQVDTSARRRIRVRQRAVVEPNDNAAITEAIAAATAGGVHGTIIEDEGRTFHVGTTVLELPAFEGVGNATRFILDDANAGVRIGPPLGTAPGNYGGTWKSGGFQIDGNNVSTKGFTINVVDGNISTITAINFAGNTDAFGVLAQNCTMHNCSACGVGTGFDFFLDGGAGGNHLCNFNPLGHRQLDFRQSFDSSAYTYAIPQDNVIDHWVFDTFGAAGGTGDGYSIRHRAGAWNVIRDCNIFNENAPALIRFETNTGGYTGGGYVNGRLQIQGRTELTGGNTASDQSAIWADMVVAGNATGLAGDIALEISGELVVSGLDRVIKWGSLTPVVSHGANITRYNPDTAPIWVPDGVGAVTRPAGTLQVDNLLTINDVPGASTRSLFVRGGIETTDDFYIRGLAAGGSIELSISGAGTPVLTLNGDTDLYRSGAAQLATGSRLSAGGGVWLPGTGSATGLTLGNGVGGPSDTNLYRYGAGILATDGHLWANQGYLQGGKTSTSEAAYLGGNVFFGPPGSAGPWDVNLYRSAANTLKTDDDFKAAGGIVLRDGATSQVALGDVGGGLAGLFLGSAFDTNLYRAAADQLKTDDTFTAPFVNAQGAAQTTASLSMRSDGAAGGKISFGDGAAAFDTFLYRSAGFTLHTDAWFEAGSTITASKGAAGQVLIGDSSGTPVVYFRSDFGTSLYSDGAGQLATGGRFSAGSLYMPGSGAASGLLFGNGVGGAADVNLYRAALDQLKTDDKLIAALGLESAAAIGLNLTNAAAEIDLGADAALKRIGTYRVGTKAGSGGVKFAAVGGSLFQHFADAGNTTTGETDLYSDSIPASVLANDGDVLYAMYGGITVAHATNTRRLRVYFGGTLIYDSTALATVAADSWDIRATLVRASSSAVRCTVSIRHSSAAAWTTATYTLVSGLTLTNAQVLKITGTSSSATNDIVAKMSDIEYCPAAV